MTVPSDTPPKPIPSPSPGTRWFWDACEDERFLLQRCGDCSELRFYPAPVCPCCSSDEWTTEAVEGTGVIESLTVVHHATSEFFEDDTPYPIALVQLDEGVRVMGNLVDCEPSTVDIGDRVELVWERRPDGTIYQFTPTAAP